MFVNFAKREVKCKVVYYGPGMSGKTTNLQIIHKKAPKKNIGLLTSIATEGDRTLFFDYMPLDLGKVRGMSTTFQLYTVPGQIYYNSTRKLVLQGVDGVVFVADSQKDKLQENIESIKNLEENLNEYDLSIKEIPLVIQWNKRDIPTAAGIDFLDKHINFYKVPTTEAVAATGEGVLATLKLIASLVLDKLNKKQELTTRQAVSDADQPKEEIVAEINDIKITKKNFLNYCQVKYRLYTRDEDVEDYKHFSKDKQTSFFEQMINEYLLVQESKKRDIPISFDEVQGQLSSYMKKFAPGSKMETCLANKKITEDNMKDEATKTIIINKIVKILIPDFHEKLKFNDSELLGFYQTNENLFQGSFDENKEKARLFLKNKKKQQLKDELYAKLRQNNKIKKNMSIV